MQFKREEHIFLLFPDENIKIFCKIINDIIIVCKIWLDASFNIYCKIKYKNVTDTKLSSFLIKVNIQNSLHKLTSMDSISIFHTENMKFKMESTLLRDRKIRLCLVITSLPVSVAS